MEPAAAFQFGTGGGDPGGAVFQFAATASATNEMANSASYGDSILTSSIKRAKTLHQLVPHIGTRLEGRTGTPTGWWWSETSINRRPRPYPGHERSAAESSAWEAHSPSSLALSSSDSG